MAVMWVPGNRLAALSRTVPLKPARSISPKQQDRARSSRKRYRICLAGRLTIVNPILIGSFEAFETIWLHPRFPEDYTRETRRKDCDDISEKVRACGGFASQSETAPHAPRTMNQSPAGRDI